MRLKDRVAIVTGGGQGIGAAYCRRLAQEGAAVVVADIAEGNARRVADQIADEGGNALGLYVDVADEASTKKLAEAVVERLGGIDILVNNAALFATLNRGPWDSFSSEEWDRVLAVNAKSVWLMALATVPAMKQRGKGKIVNIGSASVYAAESYLIHYVAAKAAVMGITRVLARELGQHNICVNCLAPGQVMSGTNDANTPRQYVNSVVERRSLKRIQTPDDLVGTVAFLVSDDADFMTGQTLVVDGGFSFVG